MKGTFWRLLLLARPLSGWLLLSVLLGLATIASSVALITTSAYLISEAALHPSIAVLEVAIVGVRFFGIARGLLRYVERLATHQAIFRLLARLRTWLYAALEPLAPARLQHYHHHNQAGYSSGDLLSRIVSDVETLQNFYARVLAPPLVAALTGICMWLFFGAFDASLALTFICCYLFSAIGIPLVTHLLSRRVGAQLVDTRSALHSEIVDHLQGLADTLAFGQEEHAAQRVQRLNHRYVAAQSYLARVSGLHEALSTLFTQATALLILLMGIQLVRAGQLNGVFLALLLLAAIASFEAVQPLAASFQQVSSSLAAARRLFVLIDAEPATRDPQLPLPLPQRQDELVVEHLRFRYSADDPYVLDDVSFTLCKGKCVALCGPSGAGKTTLANVLQRFWDYHEGHILLAGRELRAYRQEDVRRLFSVVAQDTHLFHTTVRQNLLLAKSDATEEEMMQAARQAHIHDFIVSLPRGYDTDIGEQGLCLSGGERQRLAIARAILKDAPILILDEPTAHLDALTAREITETLREVMRHRSTLLITHQADVDMADVKVVL